jgi:hypothetical protein
MISDVPRQKLCEIVGRFGKSVADDPRRCEGLLRDFCGGYRREIHALVNALKEKTVEELLSASDGVPQEVLAARLAKRLEDFRGLDKELAYWAVVSWGVALERFSLDEADSQSNGEKQLKENEQERSQQVEEPNRQWDELTTVEEEPERFRAEPQLEEDNRRKLEAGPKKTEPVKGKFSWKLVSVVAAVIALGLWYLSIPKSIAVESVKFFAAGDGLKGQLTANPANRNYKNEFRSNEAQFIWYELRLVEPAPTDMIVDVQWLQPDGETIKQDMGIRGGSYGITFGWGYRQGPFNWKLGRWVVEFSSGGKRIATGEFNISAAPPPRPPPVPPPPSSSDFQLGSLNVIGGLRFFEGPKQAPAPQSRIYQNHFDARSARYIRVEVNLKNIGHQPPQNFKIKTVWYRDGREFTRGEYEYMTPSAQQNRLYSIYYGADAPGTWQRGNYSVQLYVGSQLARTGAFVVQ